MQKLTSASLMMIATIFSQTRLAAMAVDQEGEERIVCTQDDYNRAVFIVAALIGVPVLGSLMLYHHEPTQFEKTSGGLAWLTKHYQTLMQARTAIATDTTNAALNEQLVQQAVALAKTLKLAVKDEQSTTYVAALSVTLKQHINWLAALYEFHYENWPDNKYQQQLCVQLQVMHVELVALDTWFTGWLAQAIVTQAASSQPTGTTTA